MWNLHLHLVDLTIFLENSKNIIKKEYDAFNQADHIVKVLRTVAIFRLCLPPKMRISVNLEGKCIGYKSRKVIYGVLNSPKKRTLG